MKDAAALHSLRPSTNMGREGPHRDTFLWDSARSFWRRLRLPTVSCGLVFLARQHHDRSVRLSLSLALLQADVETRRYAHELVELYSYADIVKVQKKKTLSRGLNGPFRYHLMAHVPDTANEWDFYPPARWSDKKYDAMLMGKAWREYYPLRCGRMSRILGFYAKDDDRRSTVARAVEDGTTFIRQLERGRK